MLDYRKYINIYDLSTPLGLYSFIEEMKSDNVNLDDYPEIKIYYDILCNKALKEDVDMITVDYVIKKLKNALIRYGLAHNNYDICKLYNNKDAYYYWKGD